MLAGMNKAGGKGRQTYLESNHLVRPLEYNSASTCQQVDTSRYIHKVIRHHMMNNDTLKCLQHYIEYIEAIQ